MTTILDVTKICVLAAYPLHLDTDQ